MTRALNATTGALTYLGVRSVVPLLIDRVGIERVLAALTPRDGTHAIGVDALLRPVEWLTDATPLFRRTCLFRTLARYAVLRRAGKPVQFTMGVRRASGGANGDVDGHAWLELDGVPNDAQARDFRVVLRYPS
jgi:hypothetical protein